VNSGNASNNGSASSGINVGNGAAGDANAVDPVASDPNVPKHGIANPQIEFISLPADDNKAIALTFDDGPDGDAGATSYILDQLKAANVKATFFVCGDLFSDLRTSGTAQAQVHRMLAEGHAVGNHTMFHADWTTLTPTAVDDELTEFETLFKSPVVMGDQAPPLTLVRSPYGRPFQLDPNAGIPLLPVATKHGVQIGWSIDPKDWSCTTADCVMHGLTEELSHGYWGIILMHAVYKSTGDALPQVIALLKQRGFHFVTVEDVIRSKYGVTSAEIMEANRRTPPPAQPTPPPTGTPAPPPTGTPAPPGTAH